jgi:hypothetical protein
MQVVKAEDDKVVLELSGRELSFICNAINESLRLIEEWEFHTLTGEDRKDAENLLDHLSKIQT